ncbi:AMP-binding protein [Saccharopolyspora sp. NPDC000995]
MTGHAARPSSIGGLVLRALKYHPNRIAFVHGSEQLTYAEARSMVSRLVALFGRAGLKPGDTVLQIRPNDPLQWLVNAACYVAGYQSAGIAPANLDTARLEIWLRQIQPDAIVASAAAAKAVASWRAEHPAVRAWSDSTVEGWSHLETELSTAHETHSDAAAPPESIVRLAFTSGSTGPVKGVQLSSGALGAVATMTAAAVRWPDRPRVLCPELVSGGFGNMVLPTLLGGGTFIIPPEPGAKTLLDTVESCRPNVLMVLPPTLRALLACPRRDEVDWSSIELIIYSGAVLTEAEIEQVHDLMGQVLYGVFGQVEVPKTIALIRPEDHRHPTRRSTLGTAYPGTDVRICSADGHPLPAGQAGELCVRTPTALHSYAFPRGRAPKFHGDWLRTGDVCRMDVDGFIRYLNRIEDVLLIEGHYFCPSDAEDAIIDRVGLVAGVVPSSVAGVTVFLEAAAVDDHDRAIRCALRDQAITVDAVVAIDALPRDLMGRVNRRRLEVTVP